MRSVPPAFGGLRIRTRGSWALLIVCLLAPSSVALVAADTASAASATIKLLSPANRAPVAVTPRPGFANGNLPLRWSIKFDCPGPNTGGFHTSNPEYRQVGESNWQPTARGGPFDGDGSFATPITLFPQTSPIDYEWRVFWGCGASDTFPGDQGYSGVSRFTLLPSCAGLSGKQLRKCKLERKVAQKCSSIGKRSKRRQCAKRVRALDKCKSVKKKAKRAACKRKARKIGK